EGSGLNLNFDQSKITQIALDPASSTWRWLSFDRDRQEKIPKDESILTWSQKFIADNSRNLGLELAELSSFDNTLYDPFPNQTYVTFTRQFQGIPVQSAFVQLIFSRDDTGWVLREVLNNSYGPIKLDSSSPSPISTEDAIASTGLNDLEFLSKRQIIQPKLGPDGSYEFRQATQFTLADKASDEKYSLTLANSDQSILEAMSSHSHVKQELSVETYKVSYVLKDQYAVPFAGVQVDNLKTDSKGIVDAPAATGKITLVGASGSVIDRTVNTTTTPYTFPVTFAATGKTTVTLANANPAALNAFVALNEVNSWVSQFLTPTQASLLTTGIVANVNVVGNPNTDGSKYCNAYFNGQTLTFFAQGVEGNTSCANTALIKDVMYHEWGHALDNIVGITTNPQFGGKITDNTFSEGIGDINANMAGGLPGLGLGFFLNNSTVYLRNANNLRSYPPAAGADSEIHTAGQIISGAFWDLRQNFVTLLGKIEGTKAAANLFYKHLLVTDRYIDSYQSILRLDDTDNNPATPSPNYCLINKAFANHGLTAGLVETDACTAKDPALTVRVDTDLGNGNLILIASSMGATKISFCEGKDVVCNSSGPKYLEFKPIQVANPLVQGPKLFFNAPGASSVQVKVEAGKSYTIASFGEKTVPSNPPVPTDKKEFLIGSKTISFGSRDTSKDLSQSLK
ncbi:MAG: hypothetical protein NTX25_16645, partial [Proteobacteria bacterium]|nr:hypothetical protein [Pseudomonadota bacterium]